MTESCDRTLVDLVAETVSNFPHHVAVTYDDGTTRSCLTYTEVWTRAEKISSVLRSLHITRTVIGVSVEPVINLPSIMLGILKSSSSFFPFTYDGKTFLSQVLSRLHVSCLIIQAEQLQDMEELVIERKGEIIPSLELAQYNLVLISFDRSTLEPTDFSDIAYCITTSGTTRTPKVVRVPHRCIIPNILALREKFEIYDMDTVLLASPFTFDPSIVDLFMTLTSGACLLIVPEKVKRMPSLFINIVSRRNHITVLQATPSLLFQFNPEDLKSSLLGRDTSLRILALGGEEFPPLSIVRTWLCVDCKVKIYNLYGITEVSCWSNCYHVTEKDFMCDSTHIPIGDPLAQTEVKVTDHHGNTIKQGEGHLWIGSDVRVCYIDEEKRDDCMIVWRPSGDIVNIVTDGQIIYKQRQDSQMKRLGKRLNLVAIEKAASEVNNVKQASVIYHKEKIYLFITTCTQDSSKQLTFIVSQYLLSNQPTHHQPDDIVCLPSFPITKHGKIDKHALKTWIETKLADKVDIPTGSCDLSRWLKHQWKMFLNRLSTSKAQEEEIEIHEKSNFILLGGSSLQAVHLVNYLEQALSGKHPMLLDLLLNQTFIDVHRYLHSTVNNLQSIQELSNGEHVPTQILSNFSKTNVMNNPKPVQLELNQNGSLSSFGTKNNDFMERRGENLHLDKISPQKRKHEIIEEVNLQKSKVKLSKISSESNHHWSSLKGFISRGSRYYSCSFDSNNLQNTVMYDVASCNRLVTDHMHSVAEKTCGSVKSFTQSLEQSQSNTPLQTSSYDIRQTKSTPMTNNSMDIAGKTKSDSQKSTKSATETSSERTTQTFSERTTQTSSGNTTQANSKSTTKANSESTTQTSSDTTTKKSSENTTQGNSGNTTKTLLKTINQSPSFINSKPIANKGKLNDMCSASLELKLLWKHNTGKCVDSSPMVGFSHDKKSIVFIGSHSHRFAAVLVDNSHILWEITLADRIESSPCLSRCGQYVIVGCYDGCLYSMKALTGEIAWTFRTGSSIKCSPVLDPKTGLVIFGSHDQCVYAVDIEKKHCKWKVCLSSGSIFSSPCVYRDKVYVATLGGMLCALYIVNGDVEWRYCLDKPVFSSPVCLSDFLLVAAVDGIIYAMSFQGHKLWSYQTLAPIFSSPSICHLRNHGECAIVGSHDNHLYCLDQQGQLVWSFKASSPIYATPFVFHHNSSFHWSDLLPRSADLKDNSFSLSSKYCKQELAAIENKTDGCSRSVMEKTFNSNLCCAISFKMIPKDGAVKVTENECDRAETIEEKSYIKIHSLQRTIHFSNIDNDSNNINRTQDLTSIQPKPHNGIMVHNSDLETISEQDHGLAITRKSEKPFANNFTNSVVTVATNGDLSVLDLESGNVKAFYKLPGEVFSSPVVVGDKLLVGCRDDYLYCFIIG